MSDNKKLINDGYIPHRNEKGYQPVKPTSVPKTNGEPQSGYSPTSRGDNPTNTPPGDE